MSFNLGEWWRQLSCELCKPGTDPGSPNLDLPPDYWDPAWDDLSGGFFDPPPGFEARDPFDFLDDFSLEYLGPGHGLSWEVFEW